MTTPLRICAGLILSIGLAACAQNSRPVAQTPPAFKEALVAHLMKDLRYPGDVFERRQEGISVVRFVADRDGNVRSLVLEKSSGNESFDVEAMALVRRAEPLPKFPANVTAETEEFVLPVTFRLCPSRLPIPPAEVADWQKVCRSQQ